jgi:hypothetical protein
MIITPEIDLTPESAATLERFRQLFHGGRFTALALIGGLGTTDLQTLWRTMDRVVCMAAGHQLCTAADPLSPSERLAAAQDAVYDLESLAVDWYYSLDADEQAAVIALLRSLVAWLQALGAQLSPEAQAVLAALRTLLGLLLLEQSLPATEQEPATGTGTNAN